MKRALLIFALLWPAARARAIELSLEENRAQRGNIGYVDMQRLFKLYPETIRAKENFDEVVRQAEEQVNISKAELIRLRGELSQLRFERDGEAKKLPPVGPVKPAPPPAAPSAPALDALLSTGAALLPGLSTFTVAAAGVSAEAPLIVNLPVEPAFSQLAELDEKIARKAKELEKKEKDFKEQQAEAEKNLLELESRKTEILLGKIQKVVKEVAHREGVSVVVDKGGILFGHDAVDLTDRVLKALKGS